MAARPLSAARSGLIAAICLAFAVTLWLPALRQFFALEPMGAMMWIGVLGVVATAYCLVLWRAFIPASGKLHPSARPRPKMPAIRTWLLSRQSPRWFLLAAAVLVLGGSWLFLGILEDVISGDPLVVVDAFVHESIQSLRTPAGDRFMVAVTELGDVQVVLPVIMVVLGWFIALRLWRTAVYWLAAVGVAEALVKVIKLALHRQRPDALYVGVEQFSFPSGHATLSVVVYGFLAFLLASGAPQRLRVFIVSVAMVLIGAVASSRLYLGSHWMSDVLAGLSFGTAWIAALAVSYIYQRREPLRTGHLAAAVFATFAIAATVHVVTSHGADLLRYSPAQGGSH